MRHFAWRCLAVNSLLAAALVVVAETRPQYGGTLHVAMRLAPASVDPADPTQPDSLAWRNLTLLMYETLATTDDNGRMKPALATSWVVSAGNQRWQLHLRRGVRFHDGTPLTAETAAGSLRAANPSWHVSVDGDSVVIERDAADPEMLAELALPRNAVVKRSSDSQPIGTGPFYIVEWQPGKKLTLAAEENYWRGRPFVDGIEVEMGKSYRDQVTALELGKTELVEVAAEQANWVSLEGHQLASSAPVELLALLFTRDAASPEEKMLRTALALSVERASIRSVLLQGAGQPTGGVLPDWISGYSFVFPTEADLTQARHLRDQARSVPTWTLGYDSSDSVMRVLAERIALNAKDAGLSLHPTSAVTADLRVVRVPLASADPWIALAGVAALGGSSPMNEGDSVEDLYAAEQALLASQRIIPLFHLPTCYAAAASLKNWRVRPDGSWSLADAWLEAGKP